MDLRKVFDQTVRDLKREVNKKVLKVPEIEQKVLDATSNEPWGPHGTAMAELAQATRNYNDYQMIMSILWKRLADTGRNWRHVYKSLTVFDYFVAHGAERVIDELREHVFQIQGLHDFQYVEPGGKDQGINVRKKAQSLVALLNDKEKIREVRQKAAANRDKYQGYSSSGSTFKTASYSSTGGRGYSDWDSSKKYSDWDSDKNGNGSRGPKEDRYSSAFVEDDPYDDDRVYQRSKDSDTSFKSKSPYEESQKEYKNLNEKSPSVKAAAATEADDDEFDPRSTSKPASTAAPAPAPEVDLFGDIDFFSTPSTVDPFAAPPPATTNASVDMFASSAATDMFASAAATTHTATADLFASVTTTTHTATTDLFASANSSDPFGDASNNEFGSFTSSNDFGAFTAAPAPPAAAAKSNGGDLFAADPFGQLSNLQVESKPTSQPLENLSSSASFNAFTEVKVSQPPPLTTQAAPSFQTKSSVWADSLASGLIDLNITAPKSTTALGDVGVQSSGLGSDWYFEDASGPKGKAMGSGSGLGFANLATQPLPATKGDMNGFGFGYAGLAPQQTKDEPFNFGGPAGSSHAFTGLKSNHQDDQFGIFR